MRCIIIGIVVAVASPMSFADQPPGFTKADGTQVEPYERSKSNGAKSDGKSRQHGNTNPYTGNTGTSTQSPDSSSPYYQGPDVRMQDGRSAPQPSR